MLTKEEVIHQFDANGPGITGNIFGLPFSEEQAEIIVIPVPWEVTVSYHTGAAKGPASILNASYQVDLCNVSIPDAWKVGIHMLPISESLYAESRKLRELAGKHIAALTAGEKINPDDPVLEKINEACETLNIFVKSTTQRWIDSGKQVIILGGDHSVPLGCLRALGERYDRFGVLQIDAHADLRKAYEGFTYSHASIMYNALKIPAIGRLVQVGVRDYCEEEINVIRRSMGRVKTFFDADISAHLYAGKSWDVICEQIVNELPPLVYVSFDIDGLDPKLCPNTGTPVPGGLEFHQAIYLIQKVVQAGKKIIGIDLNEVAPGHDSDWDANVGARLLFELSNWMAVSAGKLKAVF